jgi:lauroyl/myristoyl acyltransferase
MPGLKDRLADTGYGMGWSVVCRLPESWAQGAFRFSADLAWRRQGRGVQVLEGNLSRVLGSQAPGGQLRALSKEAMRSYARYWLEAFRLPVMPAGRLVAGMRDTGHSREALDYLAAGAVWSSPCRTWATTIWLPHGSSPGEQAPLPPWRSG